MSTGTPAFKGLSASLALGWPGAPLSLPGPLYAVSLPGLGPPPTTTWPAHPQQMARPTLCDSWLSRAPGRRVTLPGAVRGAGVAPSAASGLPLPGPAQAKPCSPAAQLLTG